MLAYLSIERHPTVSRVGVGGGGSWRYLRRTKRQKLALGLRERSEATCQRETHGGRNREPTEPTLFGFAEVETSRTAIPQAG